MLDAFTTISQNLREKLSQSQAVPIFLGTRGSRGYCFALWQVPSYSDPSKKYFVQQHLESQSVDGTGVLSFKYTCECMASATKHCCIHCLEVRKEAEKSLNYFMRIMITNFEIDHYPQQKHLSPFEQQLDQTINHIRHVAK